MLWGAGALVEDWLYLLADATLGGENLSKASENAMKTTLILFGLVLGWACCTAQQPDSTHKKRPNIFERRRLMMEQRMEQQAQVQWQAHERWANLPLYKSDSDHWSLSFNPPGIFEAQSAIGLGVGYQFTQHWQLWLESSYLWQMFRSANPNCIGGFRDILAVKYYFGARQSLFFAGEFRWKQVYYHDVADFIDTATNLTVPQRSYTLENIIFGGALWFGGRIRLSNDHRWRLEPSIGLGLKGRTVVRQNVPSTFHYIKYGGGSDVFGTSPEDGAPVLIYLPASVRLVYVL